MIHQVEILRRNMEDLDGRPIEMNIVGIEPNQEVPLTHPNISSLFNDESTTPSFEPPLDLSLLPRNPFGREGDQAETKLFTLTTPSYRPLGVLREEEEKGEGDEEKVLEDLELTYTHQERGFFAIPFSTDHRVDSMGFRILSRSRSSLHPRFASLSRDEIVRFSFFLTFFLIFVLIFFLTFR